MSNYKPEKMNNFKKATKKQSKLRLALFAPSGAGKTFTALRIATGLVKSAKGKIALVDTERGSASKYSDRFDFDVAELEQPTIENYIELIRGAAGQYDVLIIDSMSHGWHELIDEVEGIAKIKYKGNTWSAWSEGTPKQKKFINTILGFPGHVIATMRTKTEWQVVDGNNGKMKPARVGLAPEQGKGIEYEFDMLIEISAEHIAQVIKDRTGKYQDKTIEMPGEELGKELIKWLNGGEKVDVSQAIKDIKKAESLNRAGEIWSKWKMFQSHPEFTKAKDDIKNKILKSEEYNKSKNDTSPPPEPEADQMQSNEITMSQPAEVSEISFEKTGKIYVGNAPAGTSQKEIKNRMMGEGEVQQCLNVIKNRVFADKEGNKIDPPDWFKMVTKDRILNKEDYQKISEALKDVLNKQEISTE